MRTANLRPQASFPHANPYPELQPGGSFMNLMLAADWVRDQLESEALTQQERHDFRDAHFRLLLQMRKQVANLTELPLTPSHQWMAAVSRLSSQIGEPEPDAESMADEDGVAGDEF